MAEFQATWRERRQHSLPPDNPRPVRVCSQDERRVGWLTVRRRRLTARGVQPVGPGQPAVEGFSVDGAVAPTTGERFCLELPSLNADACQLFREAFAGACPDRLNSRLSENSGAHTAPRLRWPAHVLPVGRPPDGPERNPIERVWREAKDALAWLQCPSLDVPQVEVGDVLQAYEASTLQTLTSDASLVEAIHALVS